MSKIHTFGARLTFLFEKRNKTYKWYGDVSIAKEKDEVARKRLQSSQLCWVAGRVGV